MQNKRAMQKAWVMTSWDNQMQAVQQRLHSYKTLRATRVSKQLPWRVLWNREGTGTKQMEVKHDTGNESK